MVEIQSAWLVLPKANRPQHYHQFYRLSSNRFGGIQAKPQLEAYIADDVWLRNARHANAMATELSRGLAAIEGDTNQRIKRLGDWVACLMRY